jgi:hypothetical protein
LAFELIDLNKRFKLNRWITMYSTEAGLHQHVAMSVYSKESNTCEYERKCALSNSICERHDPFILNDIGGWNDCSGFLHILFPSIDFDYVFMDEISPVIEYVLNVRGTDFDRMANLATRLYCNTSDYVADGKYFKSEIKN